MRRQWHLKATWVYPCSFPHSLPRQVRKTGPPPAHLPPTWAQDPSTDPGFPSGSALPTPFLPGLRPHLLGHRSQKRWDLNLPPGACRGCSLPSQVPRCSDLPGPWAWKEICWAWKLLQVYCVPGWRVALLPPAGPDAPTQGKGPRQGHGERAPQVLAECCPLSTNCLMQKVVTVPEC